MVMLIEIRKGIAYVDGRKWGKVKFGLGNCVLNILFYNNRDGDREYRLLVDGVDETDNFRDSVISEYGNINNVSLRESFYRYCNIK